jgi:hypothetical protein
VKVRRRGFLPAALVVAAALSACQTVVVKSYRDPSVGKLTFNRSLAVVDFSGYRDSERIRRAGETELVNSLPGLNLVPSYRFFSLEELANIGEMKSRAAAEGFDGLVLLQVKGVKAGRGPSVLVATPDGLSWEEREPWIEVRVSAAVVSVRRVLYPIAQVEDREVWSGVIERVDDKGKKRDVRAVVRAVARKIRSDHVVD